jgi:hypothetical protein
MAWCGRPTVVEDIVDKIRALATRGLSASQIGYEVNKSRNAIIGLCHRRGIALTGQNSGSRKRTWEEPPSIPRKQTAVRKPRTPTGIKAKAPHPPVKLRPVMRVRRSASRIEPRCMWHACGGVVEPGEGFCEAHRKQAKAGL